MAQKTIVLTTIGTRGDVQPYAALGLALKKAGYDVKLAAPENFGPWIEELGLEFRRCGPDSKAFVTAPEIREYLDKSIFVQLRDARRIGLNFLKSITEDIYLATRDADLIIFHPKADFSVDVAEAKNIPAIMGAFQPFTPTREFPIMILPWRTLGPWFNKASYSMIYLSRVLYNRYLNECRRDFLDLPPRKLLSHPTAIGANHAPILYAFSQHVVPRPADWQKEAHITGYWLLDAQSDWAPSAELEEFLSRGAPPIYIGFGSMPLKDPRAAGRMITEALSDVGARAVMARGWADLIPGECAHGNRNIFLIGEAPHEHLFPHMAGVVHHGGAGTTAAGLIAGCPTLVCPFLVDQPFWGLRIEDLGAGPAPLPPKKWTRDKLARSFQKLIETQVYRQNAAGLSQKIKSEDGCARAIELIRTYLG